MKFSSGSLTMGDISTSINSLPVVTLYTLTILTARSAEIPGLLFSIAEMQSNHETYPWLDCSFSWIFQTIMWKWKFSLLIFTESKENSEVCQTFSHKRFLAWIHNKLSVSDDKHAFGESIVSRLPETVKSCRGWRLAFIEEHPAFDSVEGSLLLHQGVSGKTDDPDLLAALEIWITKIQETKPDWLQKTA